jgi:hypothetical protein
MIKIICTTQKEKSELLEASQYLASLKNFTSNPKSTEFFKNLYKNPGDIEIMEDGINLQKFNLPKKTSKGLKDLFNL